MKMVLSGAKLPLLEKIDQKLTSIFVYHPTRPNKYQINSYKAQIKAATHMTNKMSYLRRVERETR